MDSAFGKLAAALASLTGFVLSLGLFCLYAWGRGLGEAMNQRERLQWPDDALPVLAVALTVFGACVSAAWPLSRLAKLAGRMKPPAAPRRAMAGLTFAAAYAVAVLTTYLTFIPDDAGAMPYVGWMVGIWVGGIGWALLAPARAYNDEAETA